MGWLADDPEAFAQAILTGLAAADERRTRGMAGHRFAARSHDRESVVSALAERFTDLLGVRW